MISEWLIAQQPAGVTDGHLQTFPTWSAVPGGQGPGQGHGPVRDDRDRGQVSVRCRCQDRYGKVLGERPRHTRTAQHDGRGDDR